MVVKGIGLCWVTKEMMFVAYDGEFLVFVVCLSAEVMNCMILFLQQKLALCFNESFTISQL